MNRSADWLHQAHSDLDLAAVSAAAGHHEWACFACHQAVEKALKAKIAGEGKEPEKKESDKGKEAMVVVGGKEK